jgi:hypothetical protein
MVHTKQTKRRSLKAAALIYKKALFKAIFLHLVTIDK